MAMCDYQQCCVCGGKTFYDAELNWKNADLEGIAQPIGSSEPEYLSGMSLDRTGSLGAVCLDCHAKGYRLKVVMEGDQGQPAA